MQQRDGGVVGVVFVMVMVTIAVIVIVVIEGYAVVQDL